MAPLLSSEPDLGSLEAEPDPACPSLRLIEERGRGKERLCLQSLADWLDSWQNGGQPLRARTSHLQTRQW